MNNQYYLYWLAAQQKSEIERISLSRSWRYTAGFRKIMKLLRTYKNRNKNVEHKVLVNENDRYDKINELNLGRLKFVVFAHEFSRTGAPIVTLNLVENLGYDPSEVLVVSPKPGPLLEEFKKFARVFVYEKDLSLLSDLVLQHKTRFKEAQVILNTLTMYDESKILFSNQIKFITWAHELRSSWDIIGIDRVSSQILKSELVVSDSQILIEQINLYFEIPIKCLFIENGFTGKIVNQPESIRKNLGVSESEILLTIPGTRQIRKGYDLFPEFVEILQKYKTTKIVKIIWIGDSNDIELDTYIKSELSYYLTSNKVIILNNSPYYLDLLNASDAIVFLSREDSAPQVLTASKVLNIPSFSIQQLNSFEKSTANWRSAGLAKLTDEVGNFLYGFKKKQSINISEINTWPTFIREIECALQAETNKLDAPNHVTSPSKVIKEKVLIPVSVIVIFYNQETFVEGRLNSIENQSVSPAEIIIIDDFSTDGTKREISAFAAKWDSRKFRILNNSYNKKIPTLNWLEGVLASENDVVWIIEGDDLSDPLFLEKTYNTMLANGVDIVVSANVLIPDSLREVKENRDSFDDGSLSMFPLLSSIIPKEPMLSINDIRRLALNMGNPFYNIGQFLWKKDIILKALKKSGHELSLFCDYEVYLNIERDSKVYLLAQNLNYFQTHANTIRAKTSVNDYITQSLILFESHIAHDTTICISNKLQYLVNILRLVSDDEDAFDLILEMMNSSRKSFHTDSILFLNYYTGQKYIYRDSMSMLINSLSTHYDILTLTLPIAFSQKQLQKIIEILSSKFVISDSTANDFTIWGTKVPQFNIVDQNNLKFSKYNWQNSDLLIFIGNPEEIFLVGWPQNRVFFMPKNLQFENIGALTMNLFRYIEGVLASHKKY